MEQGRRSGQMTVFWVSCAASLRKRAAPGEVTRVVALGSSRFPPLQRLKKHDFFPFNVSVLGRKTRAQRFKIIELCTLP